MSKRLIRGAITLTALFVALSACVTAAASTRDDNQFVGHQPLKTTSTNNTSSVDPGIESNYTVKSADKGIVITDKSKGSDAGFIIRHPPTSIVSDISQLHWNGIIYEATSSLTKVVGNELGVTQDHGHLKVFSIPGANPNLQIAVEVSNGKYVTAIRLAIK
jgi:hypothetical protein